MARHLKLPIHDVIDQVIGSLRVSPNLVLQVDTGAGKTTVVPLALLEEGEAVARGTIYVLQPRRMAAVGAARRMARLLRENVGQTVGYRVRHESVTGPETRIEVITAGIFTRVLRNNTRLSGVGAVVLDEFHERTVDLDFCMALCRGLQLERHPDLRLVVMSATLGELGQRLCQRLGDCPRIFHTGRRFPIDVRTVGWSRTGEQGLEKKVVELVRMALAKDQGDILVFLPSRQEIWAVLAMLHNSHGIGDGRAPRGMPPGLRLRSAAQRGQGEAISVLPLHGLLTPQEQDEVMAASVGGRRRVILATPVAESSLTIPGVRVVIDSGKRQIKQFFLKSQTSVLRTVEISRASAEQRAGRAGRTGPGICYRMLEEGEEQWADSDQPEILREDLCAGVLELMTLGVCSDDEIASLPWVDAPSSKAVEAAREALGRMKAASVCAETGSLLPRGKDVGRLPSHPRLAHVVLQAAMLWGRASAREACDFAALLEEKEVLEAGRAHFGVDLLPRYSALRDLRATGVNTFTQQRVLKVSEQLSALLGLTVSLDEEREPLDPACAGLMVAWAYPEFVAERVKDWVDKPAGPMAGFRMANGAEVFLDVNDPLAASPWLAIAELRGSRISWACAADPDYLRECGVDVRNPQQHEVFAGDLGRLLKERFTPPPPLITPIPIDPEEARIDPCTGKKLTLGALRIQAAEEGAIELKHFWHYECLPPGEPGAGVRRTDPADGNCLTLEQFADHAAARFRDAKELELYWYETCRPLERRSRRLEREDYFRPRDRAKAEGAESGEPGHGKDGPASETQGKLVTVNGKGDEAVLRKPLPKKKEKKQSVVRKAWPQWPRRVLQNQIDADIEEWLHSIDGRGALCEYHLAIADCYDSTTQILSLYTKVKEGGEREWVGNEFFEDIGISKIGHKKLFSKWFNDSLTLIDAEPDPREEEDAKAREEAERSVRELAERSARLAQEATSVQQTGGRGRMATIVEEDEVMQAVEDDLIEEWG